MGRTLATQTPGLGENPRTHIKPGSGVFCHPSPVARQRYQPEILRKLKGPISLVYTVPDNTRRTLPYTRWWWGVKTDT